MVELPDASRRMVLGGALAGGVIAATAQSALAKGPGKRPKTQKSMTNVPFEVHETVRIGLIGLGNRGGGMLLGWGDVPGAVVTAVCDIRADRAKRSADRLVADGKPRPLEFGGSADSYKELLKRDDIDLVYIATPWEFHYEQGKAALESGKHVSVELPIATELDELWDLVDTSERTGKHLMLAENCSYGRNELAMLKMAHEGMFGEITNGHGGYLHDLRSLLFSDSYYTDAWRRKWHTRSTASFYPMHGLAPIAAAMDINRGDRFTTLQATATAPKGLADYRARYVPKDHPSWQEEYINGDLVTCLINTDRGRVIRAEHDVSSPRPYSRINSIAGSRGIFEDYNARVYLEPDHSGHAWANWAPYRDEFDHWIWKKVGEDAANAGHGGIDYLLQWRTVQTMRAGLVPDIDVYDSAAWCSPVPLSVMSLADGGKPVEVPDFTRGEWAKLRLGLDSRESDMPPVA
ncbi:putative dehydrogenase [Arthrobacter pigmenti]|uniref:Glycosyl hydrolase family 109 protein n=1 Tax=Arthrobacter pigmenti TaxID=271432 RepID=A0A846RR47_9MICC|nr:Gfo/Idh/MocA family oxidoreductase [Arthrobacter pigmenti]NJC24030.1 putative dehydrogenase [Arthrobacter pigmenti]